MIQQESVKWEYFLNFSDKRWWSLQSSHRNLIMLFIKTKFTWFSCESKSFIDWVWWYWLSYWCLLCNYYEIISHLNCKPFTFCVWEGQSRLSVQFWGPHCLTYNALMSKYFVIVTRPELVYFICEINKYVYTYLKFIFVMTVTNGCMSCEKMHWRAENIWWITWIF